MGFVRWERFPLEDWDRREGTTLNLVKGGETTVGGVLSSRLEVIVVLVSSSYLVFFFFFYVPSV